MINREYDDEWGQKDIGEKMDDLAKDYWDAGDEEEAERVKDVYDSERNFLEADPDEWENNLRRDNAKTW